MLDRFKKLKMHGFRNDCQRPTLLVTALVISYLGFISGDVVQLTSQNMDSILANNELVFVNFYADWCRFSQMLTPIFEEAEKKVREEFPEEGRVVFGKVDCDRESALSSVYKVGKYPTLKIFRHGVAAKREYRGQRSRDAIANFIRDQLTSPVAVVTNLDDLDNLEWQKAHVIGYYDSDQSDDYKVFLRVANVLRQDCKFHAATGPITAKERIAGNKVVYRPSVEPENEITYSSGSTGDFDLLLRWTTDKCVPLVRELTFENAEDLTEEGLPFLLLFHDPNDLQTPLTFKNQVAVDLIPNRNFVNFLTADGSKFTHPLQHLGKKKDDLPILVLDSFKHMYIWPHDPLTDLEKPDLLKQFVADLLSGKLHRDFHNEGPKDLPRRIKHETAGGNTSLSADENAVTETDDHDEGALHFDVQQQLIIGSDGVRIQIMRVIRLGSADEPVDLSEHLNKLFDSLTDLTIGSDDSHHSDSNDTSDVVSDHFPKDFDDGSDQFWMKLVDDNEEQQEQENNRNSSKEQESPQVTIHVHSDSETTTTVLKASHTIKVPTKEKHNYPPNSIFAKLAPSKERYTILRDEL